jgi:fructose/tagatose bisphosphate aldolase
MTGLNGIVPAGVVTGDNLLKLMTYCREHHIALPAFNCTSSSSINAILEAAKVLKSPVIIQVTFLSIASHLDSFFLTGKDSTFFEIIFVM